MLKQIGYGIHTNMLCFARRSDAIHSRVAVVLKVYALGVERPYSCGSFQQWVALDLIIPYQAPKKGSLRALEGLLARPGKVTQKTFQGLV